MKNWKKNLITAAILVTVCSGIYLNWVYTGGDDTKNLEDTLDAEKVMSDDLLYMGDDSVEVGGDNNTITDYFAAVRLSRQEARDNAVSLLQEAMAYTEENAEVANANKTLEGIVQTALCEAQIESLVVAKGYVDCVAYIGDEGISVAVASPENGLQQEDVALIADIVMSQSDYTMEKIRVVEVM